MPKSTGKYVFVRRLSDGKTMDLNLYEWDNMHEISKDIRQQGATSVGATFELIEEIDISKPPVDVVSHGEPPVTKGVGALQIEDDELECPICGHVAKDEDAIKGHKKLAHD